MGEALSSSPDLYTYSDYLLFPEHERWELIEGVPVNMSPAPTTRHQRVAFSLSGQVYQQLRGRTCTGFNAPTDVRLPLADEADDFVANVVQPDVFIVCDPKKIDRRGVRGAPDFVAEVLSEKTEAQDRGNKMQLYARRGVREYWIIDPDANTLEVRLLQDDRSWGPAKTLTAQDGTVALSAVDDVAIDLKELFAD